MLGLLACNEVLHLSPRGASELLSLTPGSRTYSRVVDSTFTTQGPQVDRYIKQSLVGALSEDLTGREGRLVEVFRAEEGLGVGGPFHPFRTEWWWVPSDSSGIQFVERVIDNRRRRILRLPIVSGARWNGNALNIDEFELYRYEQVDTAVEVGGRRFEHCVVVREKEEQTGISFKDAYAVYAPGIGIIKKYDKTWITDGPNGEFNPDRSRVYLEEWVQGPD